MKLNKMLKTFVADTNIVLVDIDEPANVNGYSQFFPSVFRGIRTLGTAKELRGIVNSWDNINNYDVVLAGITYREDEQGNHDNFIVLYFRIEK